MNFINNSYSYYSYFDMYRGPDNYQIIFITDILIFIGVQP